MQHTHHYHRSRWNDGIEMSREEQYALDALTCRYVDAVQRSERPNIHAYIEEMPRASRAIVSFLCYWNAVARDLPDPE